MQVRARSKSWNDLPPEYRCCETRRAIIVSEEATVYTLDLSTSCIEVTQCAHCMTKFSATKFVAIVDPPQNVSWPMVALGMVDLEEGGINEPQ